MKTAACAASKRSMMHSPDYRSALMLTIALAVSATTMAADAPPVPRWSVDKANQ